MDDIGYMALALREARRAARVGEIPVGAVVVAGRPLEILGAGHNLSITRSDPTAHAEVVALRRAARRARNHRLTGASMYVTLEPCLLCLGAIVQARLARVIYGAADPKSGALAAARLPPVAEILHHRFETAGGVMAEESAALLRGFFSARRLARHSRA